MKNVGGSGRRLRASDAREQWLWLMGQFPQGKLKIKAPLGWILWPFFNGLLLFFYILLLSFSLSFLFFFSQKYCHVNLLNYMLRSFVVASGDESALREPMDWLQGVWDFMWRSYL
jgi:hypothetical protein